MIRQGSKWLFKPPLGYGLDFSHPFAASGLRGLWLLNEGGGPIADLSGNSNHGTFTGAPAWGSGPWGSQIGGFTTSAYIPVDGAAAGISVGYPFWAAVIGVNTDVTADMRLLSLGNSGTGAQRLILRFNEPANGSVGCFTRNDANTGVDMNVSVGITSDGNPHLIAGVNASATDRRLIFDGVQVASDTTSIAAPFTFDQVTLGIDRNSGGVSNEFLGSILWAAVGQGAIPDFAALWADFWAPYLTPTYRRWYAPATAGYTGALFPWMVDPGVNNRGNPTVMIPY